MNRKLLMVFSMVIVASMLLAACGTPTAAPTAEPPVVTEAPTAAPTEAPTAAPTEVPTEAPVATTERKGGWLDEIVFSAIDSTSAITQIKAGAIDIYADGLASNSLQELKDSGLPYAQASGLYYDFLFNPAGPEFADGRLNPFSSRKIREAMNWAIDRDYLNQEIFNGGALAKFFAITTQFPDYADLADTARKLESFYAFNMDKAKEVVDAEMAAMGATLVDGKWNYKDAPVTLILVIRNDSDRTRLPMGAYLTQQLETLGFTVDAQQKSGSEASPIWIGSDPTEGLWHVYTAAWSATVLDRDQSNIFQEMYLNSSAQGIPAFLQNVSDPEFKTLGDRLARGDFKTVEERHDMMVRALELSLQDSLQLFLIDGKQYIPHADNVVATADLAAGVQGSQIYPYTLRFADEEGGTLKWASQDLFGDAWNPIAGSNWAYDQAAMRGTQNGDIMYDPYTGLVHPLRIESATITMQEGLPVGATLPWVTLEFAPEIVVPMDALAGWDAEKQVFITAEEKLPFDVVALADAAKAAEEAVPALEQALADATAALAAAPATATAEEKSALETAVADAQWYLDEGKAAVDPAKEKAAAAETRTQYTALRKSVVVYPADFFETVKWHDGTPISMADIWMSLILTFDRADEKSALYDPQSVPTFQVFAEGFNGFKITSTDPLTLEWYSDVYGLDAELNFTGAWPVYTFGDGSFQVMAMGNKAEMDGKLAWSVDKALDKEVEQTSLIGGPSLEILAATLDDMIANKTVPYEATLGQVITPDEAVARYEALKAWYVAHDHFWVGAGPYYLDQVFLTEKSLTVKHNPDYPDLADRWSNYAAPKLAEVEIEAPAQIKVGEAATFDVYVTYEAAPYAANEIKQVKYLLYNAANEMVETAEATLVEDGHYQVVLTAEATTALGAGSSKLEIAVVPFTVSQPTFQSVEFVTAE
jgi:hypothetical protein